MEKELKGLSRRGGGRLFIFPEQSQEISECELSLSRMRHPR